MRIRKPTETTDSFFLVLLYTVAAGAASGAAHFFSISYLQHLGLNTTKINYAQSSGGFRPDITSPFDSLSAFLQLPFFTYLLIFICIIFSFTVGFLVLRLLKTRDSGKITFVALLVILTILAVNSMLSSVSIFPTNLTALLTVYLVAYMASAAIVRIIEDIRVKRRKSLLGHSKAMDDHEKASKRHIK